MPLLAYFLSAALGGGAVVLLRHRPRVAAAVGLVATGLCLLAALLISDDTTLTVGATTLQASTYVRLFLAGGALALLVSQVAGLAHGWQRDLPLATLGALGLVGLALTVSTPAAAMLLVAAAGTFVVIASLERAISMPAVRAVASGLRLAAIAGFMGLIAIAITGEDPIFVAPDVLAGATVLMATAVAIRVGAVPVHQPVARLIERARTAALPLLAAWVPAAFAIVALGWSASLVAVGETTPLSVAVMLVGAVTVALASVVVLVDDDLIRLLGYGVIADGGFILLALAANDAPAIAAGLAWLVCFALARTLMAGVLLGFQGAFDARRTRELTGWLRRTPLLGVALVASLLVGIGLPGTLPWQVRLSLAQEALGETGGLALVLVALIPLLALGRLAWAGAQTPGPLVAEGKSERFVRPPRDADATLAPGSERAMAGAAAALEPATETTMTDTEAEPPAEAPSSEGPAFETPAAGIPAAEAAEAAEVSEVPGIQAAQAAQADEAAGAAGSNAATNEPMDLGLLETTPAAGASGDSGLARQGRATRAARARRQPSVQVAVPVTNEPAEVAPPGDTSQPAESDADPRPEAPSPPVPVAEEADAPAPGDGTESRPDVLPSEPAAAPVAEEPEPAAAPVATPSEPVAAPDAPAKASSARSPGAAAAARTAAFLAGVRRAGSSARLAGSSAASSSGPVRELLRELPAIWALDRTLIASLAMLVLALVAVAVAFDAVGLGAAADAAAGAAAP